MEALPIFDRLPTIFAWNNSILVLKILAVGDFASDNHLARAARDHVKIICSRVHLRVVPKTIHFRQTQNRLLTMRAVKHEYAEIACLYMHRPAAERLRASAARLR